MNKIFAPAPSFFVYILIFVGILFPSLSTPHSTPSDPGKKLDAVASQLIADGFSQEKINALYADPAVKFTTKGVSTFFSYFESAPSYNNFLSKKELNKASQYMQAHTKTLDQAEKQFGVDKTIITAILLVETRLGTYLGSHYTLNILSTIASLKNPALREIIWAAIPKKSRPSRETFLKKIEYRSSWGYNELKAFIQYADKEDIAPQTIKGSFAGAIGICQFMPSNALTLAKDGNQDGRVDLFSHEDAIFSIANYLSNNGWKPKMTLQQQYDVIYSYNHSNYYVDTIQKISDHLKES